MKRLFNFLLLVTTIVPLIKTANGPSEDDFKELSLLEKGPLSLTTKDSSLGEAYYKFTSINQGKYMTSRLQHMSKAALSIYYFREFADIKRNGQSFDGYLKLCNMTDLFECPLMGSGGSGGHTFWIIIKLVNSNEIYEGAIEFFNEENEIPLTLHQMFHIKKFYGNEQLFFGFEIPANITDSYEIICRNKIPNAKNAYALYKYESGVPSLLDNKTDDNYLYEMNTPGKYRLQVISDGVDDTADVTVILQIESPELNKAIKMELGKKYSVIGYETRYFNYFVKLDTMAKGEENVATITLSNPVYGGALRGIYSMVITTNDEEAIADYYFPIPPEDSQFPVQAEFNDENIMHLHFYNNQGSTTEFAYLLITLEFYPDSLTLPTEMNVAVAKKMEVIDFTNTTQTELIQYINREEDVPVTKRFLFAQDDPSTYVFYFSNNITVRYYEGTFLDSSSFNIFTHTESLFSFRNYYRDRQIFELSINFFGKPIGQFMRVLKLTSQVDYFEIRMEKTMTITHLNNSIPYYYLADNEVSMAKYIHIEEIYGNCEVYYKTSVKDQNDPIFPTSAHTVDKNLIKVDGVADIISVNCHFPGKFIMHFFGEQNANLDEINSKRWLYLPKDGQGCLNINIEISSIYMLGYSPYKGTIDMNRVESGAVAWTEKMTNGAKAVKGRSFKSGDKLCLNATGEETVASISFTLDTEYLNVTSDVILTSSTYIIYYMPTDLEYSEIRFALSGINTDFKYGFVRQKCTEADCDRFAPYLSKSWIDDKIDQEWLMADKYQFRIENPYDKRGSSSDYKHYLALELLNFDEHEFTPYNITIKKMDRPNYYVVPQNEVAFIQEDATSNSTMEFVELEQTEDYRTRYVVIAQKTNEKYPQMIFQRNFYQDYGVYRLDTKYNVFYLNNLGVDSQLTAFFYTTVPADYNCVEVTYKMLTQGQTFDEESIKKMNEFKTQINYTHNGTILEWTPLENCTGYTVFVAQKDTIDYDLMDNDCYLYGVYETWLKNKTMPTGFMLINETTDPSQEYDSAGEEYYAAVVGYVSYPMKFRVHYKPITIRDFDPTIPEEDFIKVNPFEKKYFALGLHVTEAYYTITTSDVQTDTVIKLVDPMSPNVVLYVFDDLYAIQRDPQGGAGYEGYIAVYDLNGKMEVVHPGDKTKTGTRKFYLVFQNDHSVYDMTWHFFNERDHIPLDDNDAYYFDNMYSLNELSFTFTSYPNETTECIFKSQYSYIEQVTTIYKRNKSGSVEEWIEMVKSENQSVSYTVEKTNNGLFLINIKSKNPATASTARRIISIRQKSWQVFALAEDSVYKDILVDPRILYFSLNIDHWDKDEENMLTIYQHPDFELGSVTYWAKVVNCIDNETEILKAMPQSASENEFFIDMATEAENYYHIPFKKTKTKQTGVKTFLLLTVTFKTEKSFFTPRNLTIAASERVEVLVLSTLLPELQHWDDTRLKPYIPKITKYTLSIGDNNTYLVYVNSPNASTFFYGDIIDNTGHLSENSDHTQFYSFSNGEDSAEAPKILYFYVKYFADERYFETFTLKTQSKALIIPDKNRTVHDVEVDITDCDRGFVLTGSYNEPKETAFAYIEQLYGSFNFYYKGEMQMDEEQQQILPGEDQKVGYFFDLGMQMDILKVTCTYPGKFLLHFLDKTSTIQPDERNYFYLQGGDVVTKTLPQGDGIDIEIATHLGVNITGNVYGTSYSLSNYKPKESFYFTKVGVGGTIEMTATEDTVIMVNYIDSQNMYRILDSDVRNISDKYFLIYLPYSRKDYSELRIDVKRLEKDFYYIFGRCNADNEPEYIPAARFGTVVKANTLYGHIYHKVIDNPSDKQNSTTYNHFIAFYTGENTGAYDVDIQYMNKQSFDDLDTEDIGYLAELPHVAFYTSIQIQKHNSKYYTFAAKKCGLYNQILFVKNYYTLYKKYDLNKVYSGFTFRTIGNIIQVSGDYSSTIPTDITGFEFSYSTS
ncbi:MAG: hypothetical protein MJ252_05850, partial [archaeon]|nr:hypothetical protein [archaeon]